MDMIDSDASIPHLSLNGTTRTQTMTSDMNDTTSSRLSIPSTPILKHTIPYIVLNSIIK